MNRRLLFYNALRGNVIEARWPWQWKGMLLMCVNYMYVISDGRPLLTIKWNGVCNSPYSKESEKTSTGDQIITQYKMGYVILIKGPVICSMLSMSCYNCYELVFYYITKISLMLLIASIWKSQSMCFMYTIGVRRCEDASKCCLHPPVKL